MGVINGQPVNAAITNAAFINKNQPDTMPFPLVVAVNSSSEALRVTQTGAGLALRVEDSSNPDASPFVVDASGNVGIGTASPAARLEVENGTGVRTAYNADADDLAIDGPSNTGITISSANNAIGSLLFADNDSNLRGAIQYTHVNNALYLSTNGSERLRIDSSGNVGIGVTAPSARIEVVDTNAGGTAVVARFRNDGTTASTSTRISLMANTNSGAAISLASFNAIATNTSGGGDLTISTSSPTGVHNERLRIDSSGNVGIGVTSPTRRLEVGGTASGNDNVIVVGTPTATANRSGLIFFRDDTATDRWAAGILQQTAATAFSIRDIVAGTERLRIDSSGRVLVGTTNANANILAEGKMAIVGVGQGQNTGLTMTGYSGTSSTAKPILAFQKSRATSDQSLTAVVLNDELGVVSFRGADGTNFVGSSAILGEVDGAVTTGNVPGRLTFRTMSGGVLTERMRINSAGNLGLNTTNPTEYLHVASRTAGDSPTILVSNDGTGTGTATLSLFRNSGDFARIRHNPGGGNQTLEFVATHSSTPGIRFYTSLDGTTLTERLRIDSAGNFSINSTAAAGNVGIGTNTFGTSANRTFSILSGTEPSTAVADTIQINSVDLTAGNTIPAIRAEGNGITNAGITNTAVTTKIAIKINGTVYYLLATTNGT